MGVIDWLGVTAGFGLGMLGNILSNDVSTSADRVCAKILKQASSRLAPFQREEQEREWLSHLSECPTVSRKYWHAIGCFWAAPKMRRQAEAILLVANYVVPGVGRVPLELHINARRSKVVMSLLGSKLPRFMKTSITVMVLVYISLKLYLGASRNGRDEMKVFARTFGQIGNWKCDIKLKSRAVDLDLSALYEACVNNPKGSGDLILKFLRKFSEILKNPKLPR